MSHFSRIKTKIKNKSELEEALLLLQYDVKEYQELKVTGAHGIKHETVTADLAIGSDVGFRLNPNIDAKTHKKISTGKADNKFGISIKNFSVFFKEIENVKKISVEGPHPSGNVGIQIHKIDPINYGDKVWTINPEDVSNLGAFFRTGKFSSKRTIAVVGNSVKKRQYYKTIIGTSISKILEFSDFEYSHNNRIINGDLLSGDATGPNSYLGYYNNCLLYTSPSPRDLSTSRMPSSG